MQKSFFITSTGTGIGKTVVTCSLINQLRNADENIMAIKPLISGWEDNIHTNDTLQILTSLGLSASQKNIDKISPWRFTAPLAASMAARKENREIDYAAVVDFCKNASLNTDKGYFFIEGAGGVMAPIAENKTCLDLIIDLNIPAILVVGSYLGTISHTLTAIKAMEASGVKIQVIIINESTDCPIPLEETIVELQKFTHHQIYPLKRIKKSGFSWEYADNLLPVVT